MTKENKRTLIRGGRVYDHDGDVHNPPVSDILIEGSVIAAVGPNLDAHDGRGNDGSHRETGADIELVDASGKLVLPGFVNAHYHSHDVLAKGLLEELPLEMWQLYTAPMVAHRSKEEVRIRTLVGALECIRNGITTIQDMNVIVPFDEDYVDVVLDAYAEAGIRVIYSLSVRDLSNVASVPFLRDMLPPEIQELAGNRDEDGRELISFIEAQIRRRASPGGRLQWALSPSAPQRCTPLLLEAVAELSDRYDLPVYTHVYETKPQALHARQSYGGHGGSFVNYLDQVGLLGPRLTIVHGVWLGPEEIARLAEHDAGVALNMLSNLKLKSGVAPIPELRAAGVRLALGCDNCSCSDVQNMFQAMKLFCLLSAVSEPDPGTLTAAEALRVAMLGGARTAGLEDMLGAIRPGMKADLVILDLHDPAFLPLNSVARQLVYSESGRSVATVIIDGEVVMKDRQVLTVDEKALRSEVEDVMRRFRKDFNAVSENARRALPYMRDVHRRAWTHDVGIHRFVGR